MIKCNTTWKTQDEATRIPLKTWVNSGADLLQSVWNAGLSIFFKSTSISLFTTSLIERPWNEGTR
jgi:hypothetical protein